MLGAVAVAWLIPLRLIAPARHVPAWTEIDEDIPHGRVVVVAAEAPDGGASAREQVRVAWISPDSPKQTSRPDFTNSLTGKPLDIRPKYWLVLPDLPAA